MPINIYKEESSEKVDWLCNDIWDLPTQIDALETWLRKKAKTLPPDKYVADIGFDIRKDACGGGAVLSSESMRIMGEIGMNVYFSEYPTTIAEDMELEEEKATWKLVDKILWYDWDPLGVNDVAPRNEYSNYVHVIVELLMDRRPEKEIAERLYKIATVTMGLVGDRDHCYEIARKLIEEKTTL